MTNSAPLTERRYVAPFILITSLFFLWAFGVNLNDILIPRFKNAFALSDFQSSFIQVAFFSGYCLAALPAGRLGKDRLQARYPYRFGFVRQRRSLIRPASVVGTYAFFLVALFVMACGQSFLEVAANPYVTILGPGVSSERRLNLAQSFNAVGAVCAMLLGLFILSGKELTPEQRAALSSAQEQAYRTAQASSVRVPYALIACIFVVVALLIVTMHLPEVSEKDTETGIDERASWKKVLQQGHLIKGVVAQFLYVGAQVCRCTGRSGKLRYPLCTAQPARIDRSYRMVLPARTLDRVHARPFRWICVDEKHSCAAPSLNLWDRLVSFNSRRSVSDWYRIRLGTRADWLFSFHHVPYNFCAQHQESRPAHKAWFVPTGHGDSRRRSSSRNHGAHLRYQQHPDRLYSPSRLLPLHFIFRRKRV
jgi:NADH:ubiquinone oxidoreductase subunit 3 (subunit A)